MKPLLCLLLIFFSYPSYAPAIQTAPRITDREIIQSLAELKAGQDNLNQRFDAMNKSINQRFDDLIIMLQIMAGGLMVVGGSMLGWLVIMWRKLIRVEEKQKSFDTQ
jgi:hypothetical protein